MRVTSKDKLTSDSLIDLTGFSIYDMSGIERIELEGEFSAETLGDRLVYEWIPYFECDHCGRSDYCKYTVPHKYREGRLQDIKCGVIVDALKKYTTHTFSLLQGKENEEIQAYLDGAFHLEQFLYDAEQTTGMLISDGFLEWMGKLVPPIYGRTTHLREHLNKAAGEFQKIPELFSQKGVLFVEGWSEHAFVQKLRESRSSFFTDINLEVYEGSGNKKPKRIQMLLDRYVAQGYVIYIQGDADGSGADVFVDLVRRGSIKSDNTFTFRHDFESCIPPPLLLRALNRIGELEGVDPDGFGVATRDGDQPVGQILMEQFGLNIDSLKIELAVTVADILNNPRFNWIQDEDFKKTELGRFLMFIVKME